MLTPSSRRSLGFSLCVLLAALQLADPAAGQRGDRGSSGGGGGRPSSGGSSGGGGGGGGHSSPAPRPSPSPSPSPVPRPSAPPPSAAPRPSAPAPRYEAPSAPRHEPPRSSPAPRHDAPQPRSSGSSEGSRSDTPSATSSGRANGWDNGGYTNGRRTSPRAPASGTTAPSTPTTRDSARSSSGRNDAAGRDEGSGSVGGAGGPADGRTAPAPSARSSSDSFTRRTGVVEAPSDPSAAPRARFPRPTAPGARPIDRVGGSGASSSPRTSTPSSALRGYDYERGQPRASGPGSGRVPSGSVKAAAPKSRTGSADVARGADSARGSGASAAPKVVDYGRGPSTRSSAAFRERLARPDATDSAQAQASVRHVRTQKPALEAGIAKLRAIAAKDPQAARKIAKAGSAAARAQGIVAGVGVGSVLGPAARAGITQCFWDPPFYDDCPGSYWYPWGAGLGWYGNDFCFNFGFGSNDWHWFWPNGGFACFGPSLSFCWNFGWNTSLYWSTWSCHKPWYYYGCPATAYSTCYVPYYAPSYVSYVPSYYPVAVEPAYDAYASDAPAAAAEVPAGESSYVEAPRATQPSSASTQPINSAATRFLELGDAAFRAQRYSDAVQHYARAVENAPDHGVLYLVLADALFATRDYHYAAYALRRALVLEPALASGAIDKHGFYTDPTEFDRQLAVLELFVKDNPLDADARLVLAANNLFGARPQAAVELLEAPGASALGIDSAAALILQAARGAQYGQPASAPAATPLLLEQGKG